MIFASNTSSLPITKIAAASKHAETVIGMHYFSPVHKMPLLEIIVTDQTADWVTATCVELGKKQGKHVIVVKDGVGFYTSRVLAPMMNEAAYLVAEGVPIEKIDKAMLDWGFPVGPIKLTDEVGIDVGAKVGKIMLNAFGERMAQPEGMAKLIEDERFGRKNGRGFYLYGDKKKKGVDESVYQVLGVEPTNKSVSERGHRVALRACSSSTRPAAASARASFEARATATSARSSDSGSPLSGAVPSGSSIRSAPRRSSVGSGSSRRSTDLGSRRLRCSKRSPGAAKRSTATIR